MSYQASTGLLYLGTTEGLMTVEIGKSEKTTTDLGKINVYPNPFRPDIHRAVVIQKANLTSMPIGKNECRIFDLSGQLIITLKENRFMEFEWDGKNSEGKKCASGVYFYLLKTEVGDSEKGKIVLIR